MDQKGKQIGSVAAELGVNPKTIRYYENISLIPSANRSESGYRIYEKNDIDRISFILRARSLDFSLDDIGEILALRNRGEVPCSYVHGLVKKGIASIDNKIASLSKLREELDDIQKQSEFPQTGEILKDECTCQLIEKSGIPGA